jgi:hypothetical protein
MTAEMIAPAWMPRGPAPFRARGRSDPIRKRFVYRVAEPLVTFYEAIMRPAWSQLERGWADRVWQAASRGSRPRWSARTSSLALYSGAGFDAALTDAAARDPQVFLVDLPMLYGCA